jgi:hypothetical protein
MIAFMFHLRGAFHDHPWIAIAVFVVIAAAVFWLKRRADYD